MKKILLILLAGLALTLAACGGPEAPALDAGADTGPSLDSPTAVSPTEETETPLEEEPEPAGEPATEPVAEGDAIFPATTMEEAAIIRETDHVKGAEDPAVTIIEYGDFQ